MGAFVLDYFIVAFLIGIANFLALASTSGEDGPVAWILLALVLLLLLLALTYFVIFNGGKRGQTIGKMALGIRVCDENSGLPIGYWRPLGRLLITLGLWILLYFPGILDALWPLWDDRNQALHDKVVRSLVVKVNQPPEWRSFSGEPKLSQVNR